MALWFALSLAVLGLDQFTKYIVDTHMQLGQSIPIVSQILTLTYVRNTGAAFGLLASQTALLAAVSACAVTGVLIFRRELASAAPLVRVGVFLALGGTLGNLVDRVLLGAVRDFIYVRYFAVFNVADCGIVVGVGLIALAMLRDGRQDAGRS